MAKTNIYIDGYNLYYSRLKGTAFKWLDLVALFRDQIVMQQDPSAQVLNIKFFTAPVKASYARHGQASEHAQTQYHRALQAYRDEASGVCDQVVICSNDSDLEPALRLIRQDVPTATIGLIMPLRAQAHGDGKVPNKRLTPLAHLVRHHILDDELMRAQLPHNVPTKKKPASKPPHW